MNTIDKFELGSWLSTQKEHGSFILAGSAAPGWALEDLPRLSQDVNATTKALSVSTFKQNLGSDKGEKDLRSKIAALYSSAAVPITGDHILVMNGTSEANFVVFHSLLKAGDHAICVYPTYTQLFSIPKAAGIEVSLWHLNAEAGWQPDLSTLESLLRPTTKMLILNCPNNPTGTDFSARTKQAIIDFARAHNLLILADEIFRSLHHTYQELGSKSSFLEFDYDKIVVTSSMSKAWGMSGIRTGWLATKHQHSMELCANMRYYTSLAVGGISEIIATEILGDRCRSGVLAAALDNAKKNTTLWENFIQRHADTVSWTKPTAGGTAFVKFTTREGRPFDDVQFCQRLLKDTGVLFAPGSLCFSEKSRTDFIGYVRVHITADPGITASALPQLEEFLKKKDVNLLAADAN